MAAQASLSTRRINRILYLPSRARKLRLPWIPLTVVTVLLICSIFAPLLTSHDPSLVSIFDSRMAPGESLSHPLGTDILGRDMLARLIFGARTAMFISLVALSTGAFVGTVLGLVAGYRGGMVDILIMRAADAALGFPTVLVAMIVVTILGAGIENIILAASLSFLGLGLPPGAPAWGIMVSEGKSEILSVWWLSLFPGLAITIVVLAFNFFGDWLRDTLDPKLRRL